MYYSASYPLPQLTPLPTPGNGIINADGPLWRIQRKAGLRFFSPVNLKAFIDDILPPLLADTILELDDAAQRGVQVDLQKVLLELTTRFMGRVAYDVSLFVSNTCFEFRRKF